MGICVISALLVVIPLFSSSPTRVMLPVFFQLQPSLKGYGDSPRPYPISRLHISEGASAKFLLKKVEPECPHETKGAGVEGDVVFRIIVGTDGRVEEIHLRRGKPFLIEAAAKAVSKWQYEPYMFNGNAVEFETSATVHFRLPSKHP
jgi:TonB family protein